MTKAKMTTLLVSVAIVAAGEVHASGGLPQFDSSKFSSQMFWTVASFVILMTLLKKFVIPAIGNVLDARGKSIEDDLSSAKNLRTEADKVLTEYRAKLNEAQAEAAKTVDSARLEALAVRDRAASDLDSELNKKKEGAMAEIEQAKRKALEEVKTMAADIAMLATEKLITKKVTKTDANKMVTEAITQLKDQDALH